MRNKLIVDSHIFIKKNSATIWGYFFISPAIIGLLLFYFGPMIYSFIISFTEWDIIRPPEWTALGNYKRLFNDDLAFQSLKVTLYFTLLAVPATTIATLSAALLLNAKIKALSIFRTMFYLPSIVPMVANTALWMFLYNPMYGLLNQLLEVLGLPPQNWVFDRKTVIPSLAVIAVWGAGNAIVIYLAGLQGIPKHLYESVEIDGGNMFHQFKNVTLPMLSPVIFFNVVMGIIESMGSVKTFTQTYIMTQGGPNNASLFYVLLLHRTAFTNQEMGYACAMSWIFFIVIVLLTFIVFKTSNIWVFYESGDGNGN